MCSPSGLGGERGAGRRQPSPAPLAGSRASRRSALLTKIVVLGVSWVLLGVLVTLSPPALTVSFAQFSGTRSSQFSSWASQRFFPLRSPGLPSTWRWGTSAGAGAWHAQTTGHFSLMSAEDCFDTPTDPLCTPSPTPSTSDSTPTPEPSTSPTPSNPSPSPSPEAQTAGQMTAEEVRQWMVAVIIALGLLVLLGAVHTVGSWGRRS